ACADREGEEPLITTPSWFSQPIEMLPGADEQVVVSRRKRSVCLLAQIIAGEHPVGPITGDDSRATMTAAEVDPIADGSHRSIVLLLQVFAPEWLARLCIQAVSVPII